MKRINIIIYGLFLIIIMALIKITIIDNSYYKDRLNKLTNVYVYGNSPPRGRIYDRNYNLLADNERVLEITYKKEKNITSQDEVNLIYRIINHIDIDYSKVKDKDILELSKIRNIELDNITDIDKKAAYLYYLMNNGYSYSTKIIKREATEDEYAYFSINDIRGFDTSISSKRIYPYGDLFKSILGSVGSIPKEEKDEYLSKGYNLNDIVGLSYIEKEYEEILRGKKAVYKKINSNRLELVSPEEKGNDIVLSVDINLIKDINDIIDRRLLKAKKEPNTKYLNKTYVVIEEPNTGNILAMSGREIIGVDKEYYFKDITPYILSDSMTPGSVVKGASILVGYNNEAIKIGEKFTDECIKLYNLPRKCSAQRYGKVDDIKALAISSNVYQFKTALKVAGIDYKYNMKTDINEETFNKYRNTFKEFGLGIKTEIDLPNESIGYVGNKNTIDLYLNYVIGQYDSYTPMQLSQYITTIASNGNRLKPRLLKEVYSNYDDKVLIERIKPTVLTKVSTKDEYLKRVQEGFREVMKSGYGKNVMGKYTESAGKTGTSESFLDTDNDGVIDTETISSSFVGYAPYDNPKMTITVTTPDVSYIGSKTDYISYVNRLITREISNTYFTKYTN